MDRKVDIDTESFFLFFLLLSFALSQQLQLATTHTNKISKYSNESCRWVATCWLATHSQHQKYKKYSNCFVYSFNFVHCLHFFYLIRSNGWELYLHECALLSLEIETQTRERTKTTVARICSLRFLFFNSFSTVLCVPLRIS